MRAVLDSGERGTNETETDAIGDSPDANCSKCKKDKHKSIRKRCQMPKVGRKCKLLQIQFGINTTNPKLVTYPRFKRFQIYASIWCQPQCLRKRKG